MSRKNLQAQSNAATESVSAPASAASDAVVQRTAPKSIRSLIQGSLLAGRPRKEIEADIVEFFPNSQAAKKAAKHIAWYAGTMRKAGQLPAIVRGAAAVAEVTAEA